MTDLNGLRVLVLEDEPLVSMLLEDILADLGCIVVGPFVQIEPAMAAAEENLSAIDIAILDVNIAGQRSFPLAEKLQGAEIPFILVTGYDSSGIEPRWRAAPRLKKPFFASDLEQILAEVSAVRP